MNETKICPYCGEEIMAAAKKCRFCGEWLDGRNDKPAKINCPTCGEEIDADVTVCPFCNEPVNAEGTKTNPSAAAPSQSGGQTKSDVTSFFAKLNPDGSILKTYFLDVVFGHYADFKGTMSRKAFWMFCLTYVVVLSFSCLVPVCFGSTVFSVIYYLLILAMTVPVIAATVRRLVDAGEKWQMIFVSLIPIVGLIWLIVLLCKEGKEVAPAAKWTLFDTVCAAALVLICVVETIVCACTMHRYHYYDYYWNY